jgi:hypothetical protein
MNKTYLKDFIIDLKDKTDKSKILMSDVAVDVSVGGNKVELENRKNVRNLIY